MGDNNLVNTGTYGGGLDVFRVTAPINSTITNMTAEEATGVVYTLGIYADNGSGTAPTNLLAQSGPLTAQSNGWNNSAIYPALSITQGSYYWLAILTADGPQNYDLNQPDISGGQRNITGDIMPSTFGGTVASNGYEYAVYANGCPFTPLTVTPTPITPTLTPTVTGTINTPTVTVTPTATAT